MPSPSRVRACVVAALVAFASSAQAEVAVGDEAPDFTLRDGSGGEVNLASFRGKKHVLLAFYPRDFTPG